jgi:dCTP diphosphatase
MPSDLKDLQDLFVEFRDERDWSQFHTPKDLAINLSIEANELLELFLWKKDSELSQDSLSSIAVENVADELADVLNSVFLLAHHYQIDLPTACKDKIKKNREKYPVAKSRGRNVKYTELDKG